jgi:hypothetical protein
MKASRLAPLLLVLLVAGAHGLTLRPDARRVPASPWAAAELLVPGLFARGGERLAAPFDAPPPADRSLAWAALAGGTPTRTVPSPFVGWIPLWLALAGLWGGRGSRRAGGAVAPLALAALGVAGTLLLDHPTPAVLALGLLAALGLSRAAGGPPASAAPELAAAGACVLLAAAVIGVALRAGFATDVQALQPLLGRLDATSRDAWGPASLALEATHLRAVLDRAAVAAFAGMCALLLHLKSRTAWSAALLLVVLAADLASALSSPLGA